MQTDLPYFSLSLASLCSFSQCKSQKWDEHGSWLWRQLRLPFMTPKTCAAMRSFRSVPRPGPARSKSVSVADVPGRVQSHFVWLTFGFCKIIMVLWRGRYEGWCGCGKCFLFLLMWVGFANGGFHPPPDSACKGIKIVKYPNKCMTSFSGWGPWSHDASASAATAAAAASSGLPWWGGS